MVKSPSNFNPPAHRDLILDTFIDYLTKYPLEEITDGKKNKPNFNLSKEQWNAIMLLKKDNRLTIEEGDKGGACVIMDSDYYKEKIMELLNDDTTYKEINNENIEKKIVIKIKRLVRKYADHLTEKETEYLTNFEYKSSNIYGLPKVHKCNEILSNSQHNPKEYVVMNCPKSLTMRPIIAGPQCVTSRLSNFIDKLLRPLLMRVDSSILEMISTSLQKCPGTLTNTRYLQLLIFQTCTQTSIIT